VVRIFVRRVAHDVGSLVGRRGLNLLSGLGRVVGPGAVGGLVDALYGTASGALSRRLTVRPIPNVTPEGISVDEFQKRFREDLIAQSGIVVLVGGMREGSDAPGVLAEFEIAAAQRKVVLPIAATGHAARTIYDRILARPDLIPPEIDLNGVKRLGPDTTAPEDIVAALDACFTQITGSRGAE
jgi:hypothetical protein